MIAFSVRRGRLEIRRYRFWKGGGGELTVRAYRLWPFRHTQRVALDDAGMYDVGVETVSKPTPSQAAVSSA